MRSISMIEIIASYRWVGSIAYNSLMLNKLSCRIIGIGSSPPVFWFSLVTYHYIRLGEVLPFLCFKTIGPQGLRIMKFIQVLNNKLYLLLTIFTLGTVSIIRGSFPFMSLFT